MLPAIVAKYRQKKGRNMVERVEAWLCSDGSVHRTEREAATHEARTRLEVFQQSTNIPGDMNANTDSFIKWATDNAGPLMHALEPLMRAL